MSLRVALLTLVLAALAVAVASGLGACSGGIDRAEYTSPVSVTAAPPPAPVVPVASQGPVHSNRLPLLPPVPDEQSGLPPVTVAQLLPPPVK